jgi:hypothetical protein
MRFRNPIVAPGGRPCRGITPGGWGAMGMSLSFVMRREYHHSAGASKKSK